MNVDNETVIYATSSGTSSWMKHIEIRNMFSIDCMKQGYAEIEHVSSSKYRVDMFTKIMACNKLNQQRALNSLAEDPASGSVGPSDNQLSKWLQDALTLVYFGN